MENELNKKLLIVSIALLIVLGLVLLVPFAVANAAASFLDSVIFSPGAITIAVTMTVTVNVAALIVLYIKSTGKKRLPGLPQIHKVADGTGYEPSIYGCDIDPYRSGHTSRFLSAVVGNGFNLG